MLQTERIGGLPCEKSSGFATSMITFPDRLAAPTASSAASDPPPLVAFTTNSPWPPASANDTSLTASRRPLPLTVWRVPHHVRVGPRERLLRITCPNHDVVAELRQPTCERARAAQPSPFQEP